MKAPVLLLVAGLIGAAAVGLSATQQIPVFRSEANFVEVTVRVTDRDGKFVDGLTAGDFAVREDTRPQRVENVFQIDLPTRWDATASRRTVLYRPDMARDLQVADGRIYLLYLNAIASQDVPITRRLAGDFIDNYLMPEDIVAVWSQSGDAVMFTNDHARIRRSIDAFLGTSDIMAKPVAGTGDAARFDTRITSALKWFNSVQGRKKALLLFSAGWAGIGPVFSDRASRLSVETQLVDRVDVQINLVDTRGLVAQTSKPSNPVPRINGIDTSDNPSVAREVDEMRWLAEDTGGFAITNHNQYRESFKRIVDENSRYYVLGYQSTARSRPNWDYRDISVKVIKPGLSGIRVQARKGYIAR